MKVNFSPSREVAEIRGHIDHPIIDGDGHLIEFTPLVFDYIKKIGGGDIALRFERAFTSRSWCYARTFWALPEENTLDRLTSTLPKLLHSRMPELGLDYALLYPSMGLTLTLSFEAEVRRVLARALNTYYVDVFGAYRDRLEPVAVIPTFTPQEAIDELNYAVGELGLKAVVLQSWLPRTTEHHGQTIHWYDALGHNSAYDYDPVWAKCQSLKVSPAFHNIGYNIGTRLSPTNYVYNHLGSFASAQEATCRSLFMGGVPKRFPGLNFSFLEGGASWACQLLGDILGHYEKRNKTSVQAYNPRRFDLALAGELLDSYGEPAMTPYRDAFLKQVKAQQNAPDDPAGYDDFLESRITAAKDIVDVFSRQFYFGCEADDPLNALAFKAEFLPEGGRLNAMFASDIGHWDVPDFRGVLPEAWEMVEHGLIGLDDFRRFTCGNITDFLTGPNPEFFKGTAVESRISSVLPAAAE